MSFAPHTQEDIADMLHHIGVEDIQALFDEVPKDLIAKPFTHIPHAMSEFDLLQHGREISACNAAFQCYLGGGAYEHHIPAVCWEVAGRGEYLTAYTPYQAEASQGSLQLIYEFQTMMSRLTGMQVANASLYDGATALVESILMAIRIQGKKAPRRVVLAGSMNPHYLQTITSFLKQQAIELEVLPNCEKAGVVSTRDLEKQPPYAALVIQQPNFLGALEAVDALTDLAHQHGALVVVSVNPISLALLKDPGHYGKVGADIVCGEGQPLGNYLNGGGPYFGFMTSQKQHVRQMPGRIVGRTVDMEGKPCFTLTLQAREQHIRRSKATSNICTNQGLMVVAATIYMSLLGESGLKAVAQASLNGAHFLAKRLCESCNCRLVYSSEFFHEFVIELPMSADSFIEAMMQHGIMPGISLVKYYPGAENRMLVCVTETKSEALLERYLEKAQQCIKI